MKYALLFIELANVDYVGSNQCRSELAGSISVPLGLVRRNASLVIVFLGVFLLAVRA